MRGLGKSMVVFCLFEKLRYSNEKSTKFESALPRIEVFGGRKWQNGSSSNITQIKSLYGLDRQATKL